MGASTSKCTCGVVDRVDQVKVALDQVKRVRENLVIERLRMDGGTCRDHGEGVADTLLQVGFGGLGLKIIGEWFFGFGPQNSEGVQGSTWRHQRVCIEAKLSCVGLVAFGSTYLYLDHFALGVK